MLFRRKKPLLAVIIAGKEICRVIESELPTEKTTTVEIRTKNSEVVFVDADGNEIVHSLGNETGWFGFSVRVYPNLACQTDCIFGECADLSPEMFSKGELSGIRFQPFFLTKAKATEKELEGHGLFVRGLHYSGRITPSNVSLSCVCASCKKSFRLQSFHAGFSNCGYMYSGSGHHTITIPDSVEGCPPTLGKVSVEELATLERKLPKAPDGTTFSYLNPLRCPHCATPYIDFERFPEDREHEYYGNILFGASIMRYEPEK